MKQNNSIAKTAEEVIKKLENTKPTPMTEEETAALIKRQIELAKTLIGLDVAQTYLLTQFKLYEKQRLLLEAEIAIAEDFIFSRGFRNEYKAFKDKRLKVFNRNWKKGKLTN